MNKQGKMLIWLLISVVSFLVMSCSFMVMYLMSSDVENEVTGIVRIIPGLMFWIFLILGIVSNLVMSSIRNRIVEKGRIKRSNLQRCIGLICFFRNKAAIVADIVFILSLILLTVVQITQLVSGIVPFILISICVFAFCMHCTLNGKNFNFLIKQ